MSLKEYYTKTINTIEQGKIVEEATSLVFNNTDKEEVKKVIDTLVSSLIGGYNAYRGLDEYLNTRAHLKKWWELGQSITFENGNAGWSQCVEEMLDQMASLINDNTEDE